MAKNPTIALGQLEKHRELLKMDQTFRRKPLQQLMSEEIDHEVMKVYEVELGVTYWIYAENFMQALNCLYEVLNIEADCDEQEVTISTLNEKQLKEKMFRDEEGPRTIHIPFIDYVKTLTKPQMFACTDF